MNAEGVGQGGELYFPRRKGGKTQKVKLILTVQSRAFTFFAKQNCVFCLRSSVTATLCGLRNAQDGIELLELRLCSIGLAICKTCKYAG